jgi:hypothetical protein
MTTASPHIYLAKASDELVSHCRCHAALITYPPQMDCPWCGCGWLFTCIQCRKAFTFAKGVMVDESWEQTAERDLRNRFGRPASATDVAQWVAAMNALLEDVEVGQEYVYLDGIFIPSGVTAIEIQGWHSKHGLPYVPQVAATKDRTVLSDVLANEGYWRQTATPAHS